MVLQPDHARDVIRGKMGELFPWLLYFLPGNSVDARYPGNQEAGSHVVEFGDDHPAVRRMVAVHAHEHGQIDQRNDALAQLECAQDAFVGSVRQRGDMGRSKNLQHLGDVYSVMSAVGLPCLRMEFIYVEFHEFQLVCACFKKNGILRHAILIGTGPTQVKRRIKKNEYGLTMMFSFGIQKTTHLKITGKAWRERHFRTFFSDFAKPLIFGPSRIWLVNWGWGVPLFRFPRKKMPCLPDGFSTFP